MGIPGLNHNVFYTTPAAAFLPGSIWKRGPAVLPKLCQKNRSVYAGQNQILSKERKREFEW